MNAAVAALVGQPVERVAPLGGAYRVWLADGGEVVAKRHSQVSALSAEVAGLRWLSAAAGSLHESPTGALGGPPASRSLRSEPSNSGTLPAGTDGFGAPGGGCPQVPAVVGFDDEWLVIGAVPVGRASPGAAERFGRELATLHQARAGSFGAAPPGGPVDAWIGLAPMRNVTGARWPEWYAEHRVLPYLRTAVDQGTLHDPAPVESVCERIVELAGPAEPPARLHGDLWSGNVLWADRVWLIDPAAHGGHRESDLAMLQLFGCPHLDRILAAYDETAPLADGWRARVGLHQLFPLLVHTVLFGGGYGAQAVAAARSLA
jgi:fructosamine-3-kinase